MTPTKQPYRIQAPNATAVNVLRSWLRAVNVPLLPRKAGCDLAVTGKDGTPLFVQVSMNPDEPTKDGVLKVLARDVTGKKIEVALAAFHQITDAAGYDRAQPLDRGAGPELNEQGNPKKLHYSDEDFLVAMRHNEFRRSPNPPADRWQQYRPTIDKTVWAFLRNNFELAARHTLGYDDLASYARCWVVNFCARYEIQNPKNNDNEKLLYVYLEQRLRELRSILQKKERSMMPDVETLSLALYGRPHVDTEVTPSIDDEEVEEIDLEYVARRCELDTSTPEARRESAGKKLAELLDQLPHDQLVETLQTAAANRFFDITARKEASRRLKEHVGACASCIAKSQKEVGDALGLYELDLLPQADLLSTLRCLTQHVGEGITKTTTVATEMRISARQISYYRHAGRLLELFGADDALLPRGEELLATDVGTKEENDVFGEAIRSSPAMAVFEWFFAKDATHEELMAFILAHFKIAPSTARRRANCLMRWKKTVGTSPQLRVEEDEDLTGDDAGSVEEQL